MVSATDVSAQQLIAKVSDKLKQDEVMRPPKWSVFVKTGPHVQRQPTSEDWWYVRCASILRKAEMEGIIGVGTLRTWYGGRKARGSRAEHHVDASGNIIRKALQQLEKAGYIKKEKAGRSLAPKGKSLLHKSALEVKKDPKPVKAVKKEVAKVARTTEPRKSATENAEKAASKHSTGAKGEGKAGKPKAGKS